MNNPDLAQTPAADHGIGKIDAKKIVDGLFAAICDAAARGKEISINAFGKSKVKVKDSLARDGRNPRTPALLRDNTARSLVAAG